MLLAYMYVVCMVIVHSVVGCFAFNVDWASGR